MSTGSGPFVFLHPSDELYGADRMLLECLAAVPDGLEVEVWLPNDLAHPDLSLCALLADRGVTVRHLDLPIMRRALRTPAGLVRLVHRASKLFSALRAAEPATVYCTTTAAGIAAPVARLARVPTVIAHVQEIVTRADRLIVAATLSASHRVLAISGAVAAALPPRLRARATVVPNATPEPEHYVPLRAHEGPLRFGIASRWNGWKGHGTLLAAWDELPDGRLIVLGGPPLSGATVDVPALVAGLRQPESVQVVGEIAEPWSVLADCDVIVVPSDEPEPFGLVAIEAFARGRPVVASAAGGLLDIVEEGRTGWFFEPRDAGQLARVLASLTPAQVVAAGARARAVYEQRYATDRYARDWRAAVGVTALTG